MKFRINNNGDNPATMIDQFRSVKRAAEALTEALSNSTPHGRNYQTCDDPQTSRSDDMDLWAEFFDQVKTIEEVAYSSMIIIKEQSEK